MKSSGRSNRDCVSVKLKHQTKLAILVFSFQTEVEAWLPKSKVTLDEGEFEEVGIGATIDIWAEHEYLLEKELI